MPWNFPLLMMAKKIGQALASGRSAVLKPAEETSLTALHMAELAMEAEVPRALLNVVPGHGADVRGDLMSRIKAHMRHQCMGNLLDPEPRQDALVSDAHFDMVCRHVDKAGDILVGESVEKPFATPTVVAMPPGNGLARNDFFGPVLSVNSVRSFEGVISVASGTPYGPCASSFTTHAERAIRGARKQRSGTVTVDSNGEGDIANPFGGMTMSGFGGRDSGLHAHNQYTQLKTIWPDLPNDAHEVME
ncbi:aldehyde dehydrogenase family protein [uncultured Tateyamaria sp.]|uniref:aldehyde dehydrogenase family protein n=1 Tax=uncultured Tateyamaria sp. TaxID=455651 RepID=UPI00345B7CBD